MSSINSYDLNVGGGYARRGGHPVLGTTSGQTSVKHIFDLESSSQDEDHDELDTFVDTLTKKSLQKKLDTGPSTVVDLGRRRDVGTLAGKNIGGYVNELQDHTTTVPQGLSPRLTYRSKSNTKGPALGAQGSAKYIRSMPGRQDGTLDGWSHAPRPKFYEDDDNIWSLSDMGDPHDRAIKRQNKIRKFIFSLEENKPNG